MFDLEKKFLQDILGKIILSSLVITIIIFEGYVVIQRMNDEFIYIECCGNSTCVNITYDDTDKMCHNLTSDINYKSANISINIAT